MGDQRRNWFDLLAPKGQPPDGFALQRQPELAYASWECIRLDNAKANLATETLAALCEFVGWVVSTGPKHSPDERAAQVKTAFLSFETGCFTITDPSAVQP